MVHESRHEPKEEQFEYFASCPKGFEQLLAQELKRLCAQRVRPLTGGVSFFGSKTCGYRACLWLRIASRITRVLARVDASNAHALYAHVHEIAWQTLIPKRATIAVSARGTNKELRNTQFTALKVKDAVCDKLREVYGVRPSVQQHRPDVPLWVTVHGKKATIALDWAGESLHRRGYRHSSDAVRAPLKEALAAGMLVWGGWDHAASPAPRKAAQKRLGLPAVPPAPSFVDPLCGSGTLVLEAAMMACDRAPGLSRDYWGFEGCADFDEAAFATLLQEADERFEEGLRHCPRFLAADVDASVLAVAQESAKRLGLTSCITFIQADCEHLGATLKQANIPLDEPGFIAANPPYGVRLQAGAMDVFYQKFQQGLCELPDTWTMIAITPDAQFDTAIGFDPYATLAVYNGAIPATLRAYHLGRSFKQDVLIDALDGKQVHLTLSSDHALQFAARLRKMAKHRKKWARKQGIFAYRIYDADLPDYALSVDVFQEDKTDKLYLLLNEYQAPKEIDPVKAARRFVDARALTKALLQVPDERVFTRVRRRDKGGSQYQKNAQAPHVARVSHVPCEKTRIVVRENGHCFEVDLGSYLDTGLFLDHRITRSLVGACVQGKRFLNLFAYTGSASVYAASGGALTTTTVDMSQTYLAWARRNMQRNGFSGAAHQFIHADVLEWVQKAAHENLRFDAVFLDPPTFSNSKSMKQASWDIQRDYLSLLQCVASVLSPGGLVLFSGNLRSFKLDVSAVNHVGFQVEDITAQTIPEDFSRRPRIHFCYRLTFKQ